MTADLHAVRGFQQFLATAGGGAFLEAVDRGHKKLLQDLWDHYDAHRVSGCKGTMSIKIGYTMTQQGDVTFTAEADTKSPKAPAVKFSLWADEQGELSLASPLMRQRSSGLRDASAPAQETPHDTETGEARDLRDA